jgi:hypothetical protein
MRPFALAALLLLAACGGSSSPPPASAQPTATNTGAFAVMAVGSTLKAYVPNSNADAQGHYSVWVVNAALAQSGTSGYLGKIDLGRFGPADAIAAAGDVVLAVSISSPSIWFIDPATDKVVTELKLPDRYGAWDVSDRQAFMTGAAIDPVRRRAYVSVWSGFIVLDVDARTIIGDVFVAPTENFGFDPVANRLVAPFYLCPPPTTASGTPPPCDTYRSPDGTLITEGLNVVDLTTSEIYTYVDPAAPDQAMPLGVGPDAAAVDPTGGLALVTLEASTDLRVVDLGTADFDPVSGTFTATPVALIQPVPLTAVAIDPGSRLGFSSDEFGGIVTVVDLKAISPGGFTTAGVMPALPWGAGAWVGHSEPHGARAGVLDSKAVAWILNDPHTWLARIDLEKMAADPGEMAKAVTYTFVEPAP